MAGPWYYRSAAAGTADGLSWANARVSLATMTSVVAGDRIYVADDHAETQTTALTITFPGTNANPNIVICADRTVATPGTGDLKTTATVTTTTSADLILNGCVHGYGISFKAGTSGTSNIGLLRAGASGWQRWDNCAFGNTQTAGTIGHIILGSSTAGGVDNRIELRNPTISGPANMIMDMNAVDFLWRGGSVAAGPAGAFPTTLLGVGATGTGSGSSYQIEGVDLSNLAAGKTLVGASAHTGKVFFRGCRLGSGVTLATTPTSPGAVQTYVLDCDSGTSIEQNASVLYEGSETTDTTVVRTGGSSDTTINFSRRMVTTANAIWSKPMDGLPIHSWNSTTGANVTINLAGIWNGAALPNNDEIWLEASYHGSSSSPLFSVASGTKANVLATGSALTADSTSAWDGQVTARVNSETVAVGAIRKVASNPGRIFFCTAITTGVLAGSESAAYASAVDSGSVTDGGATFRAGVRFTLSVVLASPQPALPGPVTVSVKAARASSTYYVDPEFNPALI